MNAGIGKSASVVAVIALAALSLAAFSGCSWLGKGKEVADAWTATDNAKAASFEVSLTTVQPRSFGRPAKTETETARGAYDYLDPTRPKLRFETWIDGERIYIVQPGNGRIYIAFDGEVVSGKLTRKQNRRPTDLAIGKSVRDAFAAAIVDFRDGAPMTTPSGAQVRTILADVSRQRLCGKSLRQAVRASNRSNELGEFGLEKMNKRETKKASRECSRSLPGQVHLTFGLTDPYLSDIVVELPIRDDERRIVQTRTELHLSKIGLPQEGFAIPRQRARSLRSSELGAFLGGQSADSSSLLSRLKR